MAFVIVLVQKRKLAIVVRRIGESLDKVKTERGPRPFHLGIQSPPCRLHLLYVFHGGTPKEIPQNQSLSSLFWVFRKEKLTEKAHPNRAGKSRTKTVPVDNSDKTDTGGQNHTPSKLSKKKSDIKLIPSRQNSKPDRQLSFPNQASRTRPKEGPEPNILLGNRKLSDPTRTGSSLPGSPTVKPKINPKTQSKLSHTVSLPVLEGNQRVGNPRKHDRVNSKQHQRKNNGVVGKFDSAMGLSIIMVTLVIMLVWGRLCAILCTSAWFYFRSRYRTINNDNNTESVLNSNESDLNSKEYKKKIVLEGLLERSHRVG
ncbi:hypothetical protein PVK06_006975 [Gossypium arboreum]|uniref:Transmembrane protein n=1 Tax=Gossypium arboreum TaxID=29729 RepID=A0ABR0QGV5_GOSAR|nr:hypothetical protein PVK06_006975 [Gossypium arboreum]